MRGVRALVAVVMLVACDRRDATANATPNPTPMATPKATPKATTSAIAFESGAGSATTIVENEGFVVATIRPDGPSLAAAISTHAGRAAARKLKPFLYTYGDWCKPCVGINKHMGDPRMKDAFKGTYIVKVDVDDWKRDDWQPTGFDIKGVPFFFALTPEGRDAGRSISSNAWGDDIPENMAPPLKRFFAG